VADRRTLSAWREDGLVADRRPADLADIAQASLDGAAAGLAAAGLALDAEIARPIPVTCDAGRIRQVADNLLENALRYTDAPGRVRLRVWSDGAGVHLALGDTAPVPTAASMPHLFDRFHRGEASRSRGHGRSARGLAICKAIVAAHGGKITAAPSRLGGLTVQLTLPIGDAASARQDASSSSRTSPPSPR
jgi:two-component system sensor histidine kinase BaeS